MLTGTFGFWSQLRHKLSLDSALQLVKEQDVSSVKQLRLNSLSSAEKPGC